jgi:hypothetical protein
MLAAHVLSAFQIVCFCHLRTPVVRRSCVQRWSGRCSDRAGSFCVTACQGCVSANPCLRCATLVQPGAKIQILDLRADPLVPKADTLARRFPVCWVQPLHLSELEHGPPFTGVLRLTRRDVRDQPGDWPSDSSPHEAVGSSLRRPTKQRPCGRYTAWPLPGLSRSSRRFRRR